jgi:hypothetical protein
MITVRGHFDGKVLVLDEPISLPRGEQVLIRIESAGSDDVVNEHSGTAKALLSSAFCGMWADRNDIGSTEEFARQLREQAGRR